MASEVTTLDLSNNNLNTFSPIKNKELFSQIKELNLSNNLFVKFPTEILSMENLEILNFSKNRLISIPVKIFKLRKLRRLILDDNYLLAIPLEIGFMYNLEILSLNNNRLIEPFSNLYMNRGRELLEFCRENMLKYKKLDERRFLQIGVPNNNSIYTVGTYNILSPRLANKTVFPYTTQFVLNWERRREMICKELLHYNFDIFGLQEIDPSCFMSYFRNKFCEQGYESLFYSKKSKSNEKHGCATFWKRDQFKLVEQKCIRFDELAIDAYKSVAKDSFKNKSGFDRVIGKDNICLFTVLSTVENDNHIIVANTHIFWDPEFPDVKLYQAILIHKELKNLKKIYRNASIVLLGDFNSTNDSSVYRLFTEGLEGDDYEFLNQDFGEIGEMGLVSLNLTDIHGLKKPLTYSNKLVNYLERNQPYFNMTYYSADFKGTLDYIFISQELQAVYLLEPIDFEYVDNVGGFPTIHIPSDHVIVAAKIQIK